RSDVKTIQWPSGENEALLSKLDEARSGRSPEPSPLAMYSVICDGPRRFMSSVCLDCASGASPAADTRISKRGSLVLIGTSCENRPGSGRILLPPDQLRQFSTNGQVSRARSAASSGRHLWPVQMRLF